MSSSSAAENGKPAVECPDGERCSHGCGAPACFRYPVGQSREAPSVQSEPAFLIFFDDTDRPPEIFTLGGNAEEAARRRFEQVLGRGWNAHLFQRIDDGKRSM